MTVREHLTAAAQCDPSAARDLAGPPLPPLALTAWRVFDELHAARPIAMQGIMPLAYSEIDAYCRLTDTRLTPLDVFLVRVIDEAYVTDVAQRLSPDDPPTESPEP